MSDITDDKGGEENIGDIKRGQILDGWAAGKPLGRIAQETGLTIEVVNQNLKKMQRAFVEQGG
jgi:hypothetical protein